jgi:hypothetical protein
MIVAVDEPGHNGHLFGIESNGPLADARLDFCAAPHGKETVGLYGERLRLRNAGIDSVDFGVKDDEIGVLPFGRP